MVLRWPFLLVILVTTISENVIYTSITYNRENVIFRTITYNRVANVTDNQLLRNWFKVMSLPEKEACQDTDGLMEGDVILQVVNCDEEGARYDYMYSGKKKYKKFMGNGKVRISSVDKLKKDHQLKEGIKTGRCIIPFDSNVTSVSGNFDNDVLNGPVRIELSNDSFILGSARQGRFLGILRLFDTKDALMRVEMTGGKGVTGAWSWMYGKKLDDSVMAILGKQVNDLDVRVTGGLLGFEQKDGVVMFGPGRVVRCSSSDKAAHVLECRTVMVEVTKENCFVAVSNVRIADKEEKFLLNTHLLEFSDQEDVNRSTNCDERWQNENVTAGIKQWIKDVIRNEDPFWKEDPAPEQLKQDAIKLNLEGVKDTGRNDLLNKDGYFKTDRTNMTENKRYKKYNQGQSANIGQKEDYFMEGRAKGGALHGIVRMFGRNIQDSSNTCHYKVLPGLGFVGQFRNGKATGVCWKGLVYGSWLYGEVDGQGEFTGDNIAYIYQDLSTVLFGTFEKGLMVAGREVEIVGYRCVQGILRLQFSSPHGPEFHYDPPTKDSFGDQPLVQDPLDKKYISLAPSEEMPAAGEGAWARRDIPAGTIVVLYGGHVLTLKERDALDEQNKALIKEKGWANDSSEAMDIWKYRHWVKECELIIDIPPEYEPSNKFRGTLGHKVNHKFTPKNNCRYRTTDSARFGPIISVVTVRDIKKGEELFADYGYDPKTVNIAWFRDLYKKHIEEGNNKTVLSEKTVNMLINKP